MAAIPISNATGSGAKLLSVAVLTASDTVTFAPGDIINIRNTTAGALTLTMIGADNAVQGVPGLGNIATSGGLSTGSIAASTSVQIMFDTVKHYLQGLVTITGGAGMILSVARVQ